MPESRRHRLRRSLVGATAAALLLAAGPLSGVASAGTAAAAHTDGGAISHG